MLDAAGYAHKFLGGGSNVLIRDGELPWVMLHLVKPEPEVRLEGNIAYVDAAADLGRTVTFCAKNDLGGMEGLIGVPGTHWRSAAHERRRLWHPNRHICAGGRDLSRGKP